MDIQVAQWRRVLKEVWGYDDFRGEQLNAIRACMDGRDCFVLMATGTGKSMCYQFPAVCRRKSMQRGGTVVVVSPLLSLMEDQVLALNSLGIPACALSSAQTDTSVFERAWAGEYAVLYLTPEGIESRLHKLAELHATYGLSCVAIDESHCVSQWGHDFRPAYRRLRTVRERLGDVPLMALTATATPRVAADITEQLCMRKPFIAKTTFNRPNLFYGAEVKTGAVGKDLKAVLAGQDGPTVVYTLTKRDADTVTKMIRTFVTPPSSVGTYHAGLPMAERQRVHQAFLKDEIRIVVATVAFGMGIDKPDIRLIVHWGPAKTIEEYYQQTGRAGRDGDPSQCIMLYSAADFSTMHSLATLGTDTGGAHAAAVSRMVQDMQAFATSSACRRRQLLAYFGEEMAGGPCGGCDNCAAPKVDKRDMTDELRLIAQAVMDTGGRFGQIVPLHVLLGRSNTKLTSKFSPTQLARMSSYGKGKNHTEAWWKQAWQVAITATVLCMESGGGGTSGGRGRTYTTYALGPVGHALVRDPSSRVDPVVPPKSLLSLESRRATTSATSRDGADLTEEETTLMMSLEAGRAAAASVEGVARFMIFSNAVLRDMARYRPTTKENMLKISGVGEKSLEKYGRRFLSIIAGRSKALGLATDIRRDVASTRAQLTRVDSELPSVTPRKEEAYELYKSGRPHEEIADIFGIKPDTVLGYLADLIPNGFEVSIARLGVTPETEAEVRRCAASLAAADGVQPHMLKLRPLKAAVEVSIPEVSWNTVRLVLSVMHKESLDGASGQTQAVGVGAAAGSAGGGSRSVHKHSQVTGKKPVGASAPGSSASRVSLQRSPGSSNPSSDAPKRRLPFAATASKRAAIGTKKVGLGSPAESPWLESKPARAVRPIGASPVPKAPAVKSAASTKAVEPTLPAAKSASVGTAPGGLDKHILSFLRRQPAVEKDIIQWALTSAKCGRSAVLQSLTRLSESFDIYQSASGHWTML